MATKYSQIGYGSRGDDVKQLQKTLNSSGYNLAVDGNFGPKTDAAVKDYQKKNKLTVDGVVGKDTWGALTGAKQNGNTQVSTMSANEDPTADDGFSYEEYAPSETVQEAQRLLEQQMQNQPGAYESQWQAQIQELMDQIMGRDKFSYNLNEDALYQQYADQYAQMGRMAMMDTMGQAAAMTGGYGSSYTQSVGQQAYQGYLQQLNDKVPELYGLAFDQYQQEGQNLLNQYGLLTSQEEQEYGRYRDQVADYYAELERLTEDARYKAEDEYGKYIDDRDFDYGQYIDERNYEYQVGRDEVADEQWQAEFDESKRQYEEQMNMAEEQWAWEKAQAERAQKESGSGGSGSTGASGYDLDHVASMSSEAIANALANYQAAEDDRGLETFLDDLVNTGRIDLETALKWFEEYKTEKDDEVTDTTVDSNKKKTSGGGVRKEPFSRKNFVE